MANNPLSQIFEILQNLQTHAGNLSKDIDTKDTREETEGDLSQIFSSFGQLRTVMSKLNEQDMARLQDEVKQLFSGEQSFFDYNRDVNNILMEVYKRAQEHPATKQKIEDNLPAQAQNQNLGNVFKGWGDLLTGLQNIITNVSKQNINK